jgi:hypothetical protein
MQITASAISLNVEDVTASANFVKQHFGFSLGRAVLSSNRSKRACDSTRSVDH